VVLLDEAYIHLCDEPRGVDLVRADKNVVLLRTFSKIFGMAGLRAGFAIARKDLLARMTPWSAGAMPATATAAAQAALGETELIAARKRGNAERRSDVMRFFDAHGFRYTPSVANHLMVDARMPTPAVIEALKRKNVYVGRPWPVWPTHVRVSIGSTGEMERFKSAFLAVVAG
jgi:histidinol-phosphate/aromatic aminotransferase/cobyric acid decarboxylase-like protein